MPASSEYVNRLQEVIKNPRHQAIVSAIRWSSGQYSQYSPVKEIVLTMPTKLLHPHEEVEAMNLIDINFDNGWNGAPIAVAGLYNDHLYHQLESGLYIATHLLMDELQQVMIIDGQTRWSKLIMEDIPTTLIQLFPLEHEALYLGTWKPNYTPHTIAQVRQAAQIGCVLPSKATKFQLSVAGEGPKRIMHVQRDWFVPRKLLTIDIPFYWDEDLD